ncbi:hypothetical protein ACHAW5_000015 [Stephanodiscus triporus]|uniref:Uncharacterized protein n=1 Tax=Stephanodiscus triporus TaxID=2934178 RepID=A0ABD3N153_9STRA
MRLQRSKLGSMPVGTGTIKAVVNVFGVRQYHPILQHSMIEIETFYVQLWDESLFQNNITAAYMIPFILLLVVLVFFVAGSKQYVHVVPGQQGHEVGNGSL